MTMRNECGAEFSFPRNAVTTTVILAATARIPVMDAITLRGFMVAMGHGYNRSLG